MREFRVLEVLLNAQRQVVRDGHHPALAPLAHDFQDPSPLGLTVDADIAHILLLGVGEFIQAQTRAEQ